MSGPDKTEDLIAGLALDAQPVRRLRPPLARAAMWLGIIAVLAIVAIAWFADMEMFKRRVSDPKLALEMIGTILTGIAAIVAAFHLSLPDRSRRWMLLPLPFLALWIASSGYSCLSRWFAIGPNGWHGHGSGSGFDCFTFIVSFSIPIGASLMWVLRRAHPIAPFPVAAMGGLGVAAIGAFILQFFHPFDVTVMDLGLHVAAVAVVTAVLSLLRRPVLAAS